MKKRQKTKGIVTKKARKRFISHAPKGVTLIYAKHLFLRYLRLIRHKHTGKLVHHRHTSHVALIVILIIVGFFLYLSDAVVQADTRSETVVIGAIVPGFPPIVGAVITSPINGLRLTNQRFIDIAGTCWKNSFVVVSNNNRLAGSASCSNAGVFALRLQLWVGENALRALNYDNLNEPGPATPPVTIYLAWTSGTVQEVSAPRLPINPSIIQGVKSTISNCNDYKPDAVSIGGEPHIAVVCIPRLFSPGSLQTMGILVWGGTPPYAINIDMGDGQDDILISMPTQGYKTISFSYAISGNYRIELRLKDKDGNTTIVQTSAQVNGEVVSPIANITNDIFNKSWFETPVPFYLIAVAITLGFWAGDLFDRYFGARKIRRRKRIAV